MIITIGNNYYNVSGLNDQNLNSQLHRDMSQDVETIILLRITYYNNLIDGCVGLWVSRLGGGHYFRLLPGPVQ
jgi:hypothetical protein